MGAESLAGRLEAIRTAITEAARRAGRPPERVQIVAVTKTFPPAVVSAALELGLTHIGENYVKEARAKRDAVGGTGTWHLIGGLQRNKVRAAVAVFDRIHSVDSPALATALAAVAGLQGRKLPVLIQVNVAGATGQGGVPPDQVEGLAGTLLGLAPLALDGFMALAPPGGGDAARSCFHQLGALRDRIATRLGVELPHLSMGMSDDFVVAVEEGATLLRLGRALFGARGAGALEVR